MRLSPGTPRFLEAAALSLLLVVALLLRLTGIAAGAPFVYHPDEWAIVQPALTMIRTHDWNPHWFDWPSLSIYAYLPVAVVVRVLSGASLAVPTGHAPDGLRLYDPSDALPEQYPYFLYGRLLVALLGAATVALAYLAGRMHAGRLAALGAGVFLAVASLHVSHSRFLTPDVPATLAIATVLLLTVASVRRSSEGWVVAAGFVAGLAGGTKWNALAIVIVPSVAWLAARAGSGTSGRRVAAVTVAIVVASVLGLAIATPAIVLDNTSVVRAIDGVREHYFVIGHAGAEGADNAAYYLRLLWHSGLGPGLALLAAAGVVLAVARHRPVESAALAFVIVYFALTASSVVRFDRNLLPLLPPLALLSGSALAIVPTLIARGSRSVNRRIRLQFAPARAAERYGGAVIAAAILLAAAAPRALSAWHEGQAMTLTDTRSIAHAWLTANVPAGTQIVREDYTPQLYRSDLVVRYVDSLADRPLDWYRDHGYALAVASSLRYSRYFDGRYPVQQQAYERLFELPLIHEVCPDALQRGPCIRVIALADGERRSGRP